jgi:thiol-disulfide isomerase/thioredoxin
MKVSKLRAAALALFLTVFSLSCVSAEEVSGSETGAAEEALVLMPELRMPEVGEAAPLFEVLTVEGKAFNLKNETQGKVVSIVFWSLFCAPCRRSMPILNELHKELSKKEFELLAINMDGERMLEGVKSYVEEEGFVFTILMDEYDGETMKVADPYGVQGTPTVYIIDRNGQVAFSKAGDVERDEFRALVESELEKPRSENKAKK